MSKKVLFVHGAGEGAHKEDGRLVASLRYALGAACDVRYPEMPNEDSPEVEAWKGRIAGEFVTMDGTAVLVGHSVGALILLKYLSEEEVEKPVAGLFLVAAPYVGSGGWEIEEGALREDFAAGLPEKLPIFFYHGRDDEIVPFEHLSLYAEKLPWATFRELDGGGHQLGDDLSGVARDIRRLLARADVPESGEAPGDATMDAERSSDLPGGLGKPARRALAGDGYTRLEQLTQVSEAEVLELHGMGPKALEKIRAALSERGLSFAGERHQDPHPRRTT